MPSAGKMRTYRITSSVRKNHESTCSVQNPVGRSRRASEVDYHSCQRQAEQQNVLRLRSESKRIQASRRLTTAGYKSIKIAAFRFISALLCRRAGGGGFGLAGSMRNISEKEGRSCEPLRMLSVPESREPVLCLLFAIARI